MQKMKEMEAGNAGKNAGKCRGMGHAQQEFLKAARRTECEKGGEEESEVLDRCHVLLFKFHFCFMYMVFGCMRVCAPLVRGGQREH